MFTAHGEKYSAIVANLKEHLHEKNVQDLLEELQQEFDSALARGEEIDLDVYYAYMDVINEIEPLKEDPIDPAALFQKVQKNHPELFPVSESTPEITQRPHPKFRMKRVLMVAAVLCVLAFLLAMGAFGGKIMNGFQGLGGDLFQIGYGESGQMELETPGESGYHSLTEALEAYGLAGIEPTWVPSDYNLILVDVVELNTYRNFTAAYDNGENQFLIRVTAYTKPLLADSTYERVEEYDENYRIHGTDHFIMINNDRIQVAWENNNCLCNIAGPLSEAEVKHMIDSIYMER